MTISGSIEDVFKQFLAAQDFKPTLDLFYELCRRLSVSPSDHSAIYRVFRENLHKEATNLWKSLDKRRANTEYGEGKVCKDVNVLIVGAGPCGLRLAIECAMLGAKTVVLEAREYFSRNNVLHLWPFVIQDIKMLGGKAIFPKFCTGALDHVSIKRMQLILLKISLLVGAEIHAPVRYEGVEEPDAASGRGWRAKLNPGCCPAARLDYDVVVGANGKAGSAPFPDFSRKIMRGKLAIAITANFVNYNTQAELQIREIGGLFFIFDQEFFNNLKAKCGVELENFVYYKDDTHYFVMTVKKKSLLSKGVLKKDFADPRQLLSPDNRNKEKLHEFAKEIAMATMQNNLPGLEYARNHHGEEDVAMFDFTSMSMANHSCYIKQRHGKTLIQCIVGDSLLEPFWPTGSGCARGFLGVMDTAWLIRCWYLKELPELHLVAEREQIFQILSQTKPDNLAKAHGKYTIDPHTRYGTRLKTKTIVSIDKVRHLLDMGDGGKKSTLVPYSPPETAESSRVSAKQRKSVPSKQPPAPQIRVDRPKSDIEVVAEDSKRKKRLRGGSLDTHRLLSWFQSTLETVCNIVNIEDLNESWRDGLGLLALVELYRPNICSLQSLQASDKKTRVEIALMLVEQEFGVEPMLSADDICRPGPVDKLAMLSYLAQIHEVVENEPPKKIMKLNNSRPVLERGTAVSLTPPRSESPKQHSLSRSPSAKVMLKHLTSSMALKSMEQAVDRTQVWLSNSPGINVSTDSTTDIMDAVLRSTRTPSKLSRKKVVFKKPPPAVVKYRQSQVDIGQEKEFIVGGEKESGFSKVRPSVKLCEGIAANRLRMLERVQEGSPLAEENRDSAGKEEEKPLGQIPDWMLQSNSRAACQGKAQQRIEALHRVETIQQEPNRATLEIPSSVYESIKPALKECHSGDNQPGDGKAEDQQGKVSPRRPPQRPAPPLPPRKPRGRSTDKLQDAENKRAASPVTSDLCCVCRRTLLLVERYTAHGVFFHRNCFRCATCSTLLHVGTSVFQRKQEKACFYCYAHAYTAGAVDVEFTGGVVSEQETAKNDKTDLTKRGQQDGAVANPVYAAPSVRGQSDNVSDYSSSESESESDDDEEEEEEGAEYLSLGGSLEEDDLLTQLSTSTLPRNAKPRTLKKALRSQNSLRLLAADEIQRGLDDVENEEKELEEKGQVVEKILRTNPDQNNQDEELMDEWLDVLRRKKELVDREAKLMLKAKLVELQERHNRLQLSLKMTGMSDDMSKRVSELKADTEALEDEMECLVVQMASLSTYLVKNDSTEA